MNLADMIFGAHVKIVSRKDAGELWNTFIDQHELGVWWYRQEWLDYCLAYRGGIDLSFLIVDMQRPESVCALVPLIVEGRTFALGGNPELVALIGEVHEVLHIQAIAVTQKIIADAARQYRVGESRMMLIPIGPTDNQPPAFTCDGLESSDISFTTRVIDLTLPVAQRWAAVRKSYHQLIRRGQEKYQVWKPGEFENPMETYADLHRGHYGPVRSSKTYELQAAWAQLGVARPYIVTENGVPVGAILWYVYKSRAYYASGVFLEDNIAHVAVWESLTDLAVQGVRYAEMGWQGYAKDKKGLAVEFFKRGFGGDDWRVSCRHRYLGIEKQEATA